MCFITWHLQGLDGFVHLSPHNYVKRDDFWLKGISRHVERISQSAQLDLPILYNGTKYRIFLVQWYLICQAMIINNLKKRVASCEDWWPNKLRLPSTLTTMLPSGSVGHLVSVKRFGLSHVELPHFKTWRFRSRARLFTSRKKLNFITSSKKYITKMPALATSVQFWSSCVAGLCDDVACFFCDAFEILTRLYFCVGAQYEMLTPTEGFPFQFQVSWFTSYLSSDLQPFVLSIWLKDCLLMGEVLV